MVSFSRFKNQAIAKVTTRLPFVARILIDTFSPVALEGIPWTPLRKSLSECKVALVTTAGVYHRDQPPFDMDDRQGDPTFRAIDSGRPTSTLMITHDYYDHTDADKDINIVFPIQRLRELEGEGVIGEVAKTHYGFMGHITGPHVGTLIRQSAPEVAPRLKGDGVDVVLLTPG